MGSLTGVQADGPLLTLPRLGTRPAGTAIPEADDGSDGGRCDFRRDVPMGVVQLFPLCPQNSALSPILTSPLFLD